jgi:hypothetical protein
MHGMYVKIIEALMAVIGPGRVLLYASSRSSVSAGL